MNVKTGSFTVPGTSSNFSITDVGFQPKALLMFSTLLSAEGFGVNRSFNIGFTDGTNSRDIATVGNDGATAANGVAGRRQNTFTLETIAEAAGLVTIIQQLSLVSFDSGGFTLDPIQAPGTTCQAHYIALGGSDITNVWAGTILTPTTTGSVGYTDPGFQPDFLLLMTLGETNIVPGSYTQERFTLGAASSASLQQSLSIHDSDNIPTQVADIMVPSILDVENLGSTKFLANLTSFDSSGFTLNYTTTQATQSPVFALAIKGGKYYVGTDTQKTSTGMKSKSGFGFTPKGLMFMGVNRTSSSTKSTTESKLSVGLTDGTNQGAVWGESTDNVSTTDSNSYTATDGVLVHASNSSTLNAKATISSLDSDGYTVDWGTADATAREFTVIGFGDIPVVPPSATFIVPKWVM